MKAAGDSSGYVMFNGRPGLIDVAANVSGGVRAAKCGRFVAVVDVIDMSTTLESVREAGAVGFWGAAPSGMRLPEAVRRQTNPYLIGRAAAREARSRGAEVVVISEPRSGAEKERRENAAAVLSGLRAEKALPVSVVPNLGAETAALLNWQKTIAVAVTAAGGTVFDAVWQAGGALTTATIARTPRMRGRESAFKGIQRIIKESKGRPLTLVAASSNALEDVLAVEYLARLFCENF